MRFFNSDLRRTLEECWRDEDSWWCLFSLSSDRVQEEFGEEAGQGIRWLGLIRTRPFYSNDKQDCGVYWFVSERTQGEIVETWKHELRLSKKYGNWLTKDFYPIDRSFPGDDRMSSVNAFLDCWLTLTEHRRAELWALAEEVRKEVRA